MKETYTKEEVLKIIEEVYYDGVNAGQVEYGNQQTLSEKYMQVASCIGKN